MLLFSVFVGFTAAILTVLVYNYIRNYFLFNELNSFYEAYSEGIKFASSEISGYNLTISKHSYWIENILLRDFFSAKIGALPKIY